MNKTIQTHTEKKTEKKKTEKNQNGKPESHHKR